MKTEKNDSNKIFSIENLLKVNPDRKPLTVEKLCELSELDLSDGDAQEIIFSIRTFCFILLEVVKEKELILKSIESITNHQQLAA
ncbi:MAG: hypothetical protein AABZ32_12030 [Bacteroidota bacterium]